MQLVNTKKVEEFMAKKCMTEPEFADAMGITYSYLFRVLRGKRQPGRKFIEGLFNAGMKAEDIFLPPLLPKGNTGTDGP